MDHRSKQLEEAYQFIKSKGPYPKGELVLVAGSFNIDANIINTDKTDSFIQEMLEEYRFYQLIASRKTEVLYQYNTIISILSGNKTFNVINTNSL
jgi:hypothetical protein